MLRSEELSNLKRWGGTEVLKVPNTVREILFTSISDRLLQDIFLRQQQQAHFAFVEMVRGTYQLVEVAVACEKVMARPGHMVVTHRQSFEECIWEAVDKMIERYLLLITQEFQEFFPELNQKAISILVGWIILGK